MPKPSDPPPLVATGSAPDLRRNPGPDWGFRFLLEADRRVPAWALRPLLAAGTWVAVGVMGPQRVFSRAFLGPLLGRRAGLLHVWRHFFAFLDFLLSRFRAARGHAPCCRAADPAGGLREFLDSGEPAFFGTFHYGYSDLLGFALGGRGRRVAMVRERVGNSSDTDWLERQYAGQVSFIWSNDPAELPFRLKAAVDAGASVAMQCDRLESSARSEVLEFLGVPRRFPFAIYHLAMIFGRPVMFCLAEPDADRWLRVTASPVFRPAPDQDRTENLARARRHFQTVLETLEAKVRSNPYLWFNFQPLASAAPHPEDEVAAASTETCR